MSRQVVNTSPILAQTLADHQKVSAAAWLAERKLLLAEEKALTRLKDRVAARRRALPWVRVDKAYHFETRAGKRRLAELFAGRPQLLVQHFMLGPGWEQGCRSCSFMADHTDGMALHLAQRDVTMIAVSRAPLDEIERFRQRMGWRFDWVSSHGSDFNHDFNVSFTPQALASGQAVYNYTSSPGTETELPGISAFIRNGAGEVFHTYSTFGRGVEAMMGTYAMLDLTPLGRAGRDNQQDESMQWVRHHDRYESAGSNACCR